MASWSKERIIEYLKLYRKQECLWNIKSKEYSNCFLQEKSDQLVLNFVSEFNKTSDKDTKKINHCLSSS